MKVLLTQNLIIDDLRYRPSPFGTEIPDFTKDGRKIVLDDGKEKRPKEPRDPNGKAIPGSGDYVLPKNVRPFSDEAAKEQEQKKLPLGAKPSAKLTTLSQMAKGAPANKTTET